MFDPITFGLGFGLWKLGEYVYKEVTKPGTPPDPRKAKEVEELTAEPIYFAVAILAKFAKADGIVTKNEIATIENILRDIDLTGEKRTKAINVFRKHKDGALTYGESLSVFAALTKDSLEFRGALCILLLRLAHADGNPPQRALAGVQQACNACGVEYAKVCEVFQEAEQQKNAEINAAYEVIGCSRADSVDAIKKRYRELTKTFHPDTMSGKDIHPEITKLAVAKFREIQDAYERIISLRSATNA
jgi:DnaJ-domain-containing protein 1